MNIMMSILFATAASFPVWMSGSWAGDIGGAKSEEFWTNADGGVMLGMHRDAGKKTSFEFFRIEAKDGALVFQAQPGGRPATPFTLKSMTETRAVFENAKHDFPQRIIYWRTSEQLCARIEGTIGGKEDSEEWCWSRSSK